MTQPAHTASSPKDQKTAITPTRAQNFPDWYQAVVKGADLAENSMVRGCMVIKPWGYGIWERIQRLLDDQIKATGHDNCYFPLFIPLSLFQKEAEHVDGFAKEMAVVTHHRMVMRDGKLVPDGKLDEPLIVRPTSETIIMEAFADWIKSYRDLPVLVNQWANVVRWEMRPRMFLRTTEFLWQEGHTAHATEEEARAETRQMLEVYRILAEDILAMPVICGDKPAHERFPGAEQSLCIEAMMQDGKALQAGTSHYLGQNFSRAANIQFQDRDETVKHPFTTSWGMSTRMIGGMIMTHGDDNGLQVPPRVAPAQVVILPILRDDDRAAVMAYAEKLQTALRAQTFAGEPLRVKIDTKDTPVGSKRWDWIRKGAPLLVEVGAKDMAKNAAAVTVRTDLDAGKMFLGVDEFVTRAPALLEQVHRTLFDRAVAYRHTKMRSDITDFAAFADYFKGEDTGFVRAKWSGDPASEKQLKELAISIRCLPLDQSGTSGTCILTGAPATTDAIFAKSY